MIRGFGNRNDQRAKRLKWFRKPKWFTRETESTKNQKEGKALYKLTREERETIVNWSSADINATVYSADPVVIRKLDKLTARFPDDYKCTRFDPIYGTKYYTLPARFIRFGKPASQARIEAARRNGQVASF